MTTTAIFVELLVIGIQTSLWVVILLFACESRFLTVVDLDKLQNWEGLVTAGAFALCYSLGILVDRLADLFFLISRPSKVLLKNRWAQRLQARISAKRTDTTPFELSLKEGTGSEYFSYFRARIRITRALTVNALLTTTACIVYGFSHIDAGRERTVFILTVVLIGGGISLFSYLATGMLDIAYEARKKELRHLIQGMPNDAQPAEGLEQRG